jgi:hypothetical protein
MNLNRRSGNTPSLGCRSVHVNYIFENYGPRLPPAAHTHARYRHEHAAEHTLFVLSVKYVLNTSSRAPGRQRKSLAKIRTHNLLELALLGGRGGGGRLNLSALGRNLRLRSVALQVCI